MTALHLLLIAATLVPGGTLRGTVRSEGSLEPIPVASVRVVELDRTVIADPRGFYTLTDLPAGRWTVECEAYGYGAATVVVRSTGEGTIRLDFELRRRPVRLPGVEGRSRRSAAGELIPDVPPTRVGPPSVQLSGPSLRLLPGLAEPDVLRSLQLLPSVAAISDYSSALYVRGGSADQNLITLDGIPMFNPYHLGGVFSALPSEVVRSVEVWGGAMPAGAGDRLSSAVAIRTREGARDSMHVAGGVGLISASATVDGPLPGGKGSYLATGRHTYLDLLTRGAYALGMLDTTLPYGFSDGYLKVTRDIGELGTLTASAYLNDESVSFPERMRLRTDTDAQFDWGSRILSVGYRRPIGSSLLFQGRVGFTDFRGTFDAWTLRLTCTTEGLCSPGDERRDTVKTIEARTRARDLLAGADLTWYGRSHTIRAGAQVDAFRFDQGMATFDELDPRFFPTFNTADRPVTLAGYLEDEWTATTRLDVRAGLRALYADGYGTALLPRLGASLRVADGVSLSLGAGRYAQVMRSMKDDESIAASFIAYDVLAPQPTSAGLATAEDIVAGVDWEAADTRVRLAGYVKRFGNLLLPPQPEDPFNAPPLVTDSFRIGEGSALGLELLVSRRVGDADVTLSYALAAARRSVGDARWTPRFERRHLLDVAATLPWGYAGMLSGRLAIGTGQPFTPAIALTEWYAYDPSAGAWAIGANRVVRGAHNSERLPGYLRLDLAARREFERRWFGRDGTITPYFQVVNALNTRNALIAEPNPSGGQTFLEFLPQIPILPTLGVEWRF